LLCNGLSPHKWWSILKSAVFGSMPSPPPLLDTGVILVCLHKGKANMLNRRFESKQCRIGTYVFSCQVLAILRWRCLPFPSDLERLAECYLA
jgi:hypothetical protein